MLSWYLWQFWFPGGLVYSSVMHLRLPIVYVFFGVNVMSGDHRLSMDRKLCIRLHVRVDGALEWFSMECYKTKTKAITLTNHKRHRQLSEPIRIWSATGAKRGKMRTFFSQSVLVSVLLLIDWESGASFVNQSQSKENAKQTRITFDTQLKTAIWGTVNYKLCYYALNSLSLFWLAESVQWIFEISACDVIPANYTIIMSRSRVIMSCMTAVHDFQG